MKPFAQRFLELSNERSPFCLGIDPTPQLLKAWELPASAAGLERMCEIISDAALDKLAVVKPQIAYFERFGSHGIRVLESLIKRFHRQGSLVLIDAKRGDIGSTVAAYADALLGAESALGGDAMTVHAYLGFGSLLPLLQHAETVGAGVFVVVRSSNPEGEIVQNAMVNGGQTLADHLAESIAAFNEQAGAGSLGSVGAVIGATYQGELGNILSRMEKSLILAPGIGHQGATFEDVRNRFGDHSSRVIPSASRSVLAKGPHLEALRLEIENHCEAARR
jgi:orotidine-5'-phosphate decarboxylase